jgi:hypothetical protein
MKVFPASVPVLAPDGAARLSLGSDASVGRFLQTSLVAVSARVLVLSVQSCGGAAIALTTLAQYTQADAYEIVFGADDNTKTTIT